MALGPGYWIYRSPEDRNKFISRCLECNEEDFSDTKYQAKDWLAKHYC